MPRGDGTGPIGGGGPGTGRGQVNGIRGGRGGGRNQGSKPGVGVGGMCLCPSCGATTSHQTGVPCNQVNCPKCGNSMTRR